jgi:hypothetical protein
MKLEFFKVASLDEIKEAITNGLFGPSSCSYCNEYPICIGCPISVYTESYDCNNTPYDDILKELKKLGSWMHGNIRLKSFPETSREEFITLIAKEK